MESDPDSRGIQAAESAMCQYDILIGTLLRVQAEYPEVDIVLQPVLPLGDPTDTYPVVIPFIGDVIDATDILNEYIRIQADTWGFTFVDLHDDFLDYSDTPSPPDLSNPATSTHRMDPAFRHEFGLHLNQDGYRRWMGKISPYFAEDIQSGSIYSPDDSPPGNYTTLPPTALGLQLWSSEDQRYYWGNLTVPPSSSVEIRGDSSGNNMLAVVNADTLEIESFSHVVLPYYTQAIKGNDVAITYQNNSMSQKDVKVVFGLDEDGFSDFTLEIETSVRAKKGTNFGFLFENMVQQGNRDIGFHTSEGDSHIWFDIEIPAGKSVYGYYFNATHPAVVRSTSLYSDMRQANSTTRLYGRPTSTDFYYKNNSSENITVYLLLELNTETPNPSNGFLRIY